MRVALSLAASWLAITVMLAACGSGALAAEPEPDKPKAPRELDGEKAVKPPKSFKKFSPGEGFAIRAPGKPEVHRELSPAPGGEAAVTMYQFSHELAPCENPGRPCALLVGWVRYPKALLKKFDVERGLDGGRDAMVERAGGKLVSQERVTLGGAPGREIVFEIPVPKPLGALRARVRLFFRGDRLFVVQLLAPAELVDAAPNRAFLTSFRWAPVESGDKPHTR